MFLKRIVVASEPAKFGLPGSEFSEQATVAPAMGCVRLCFANDGDVDHVPGGTDCVCPHWLLWCVDHGLVVALAFQTESWADVALSISSKFWLIEGMTTLNM